MAAFRPILVLILATIAFLLAFQVDSSSAESLPPLKFGHRRGRTVNYDLTFTSGNYSADCGPDVPSTIFINGHPAPGPVIRARVGDTLVAKVHNKITNPKENLTVHWHGLAQFHTPTMDGATGVTDEPIPSGQTRTYKFRFQLDEAGTYFWHSHVNLQSSSMYGPLIVDDLKSPPYKYDDEKILMLGDWSHTDHITQFNDINSPEFKPPSVETGLINGRSIFNVTALTPKQLMTCPGFDVTSINPGKTYRFRVIGSQTISEYAFAIKDHDLKIIEVDGRYVKPYTTSYLEVGVAQRYSFLLVAKKPVDNYYIKLTNIWQFGINVTNAIGILHYNGAAEPPILAVPPTDKLPTVPRETPGWITSELKPLFKSDRPPTRPADQEILFRIDTIVGQNVSFKITNHTTNLSDPSIITQMFTGARSRHPDYVAALANGGFDDARDTYPIKENLVVDFVVQNVNVKGVCEAHPWHPHGVHHWMIAAGNDTYDPANPLANAYYDNPIEPPKRDVTLVYPTSGTYFQGINPQDNGKGCGWIKYRVVVDDPGAWAVHCHISWHLQLGMRVVMELGVEELKKEELKPLT